MDVKTISGAETTINMMGAMPAVAVRLERRKAEKRLKRPSQLYLAGYPHLRQQSASPSRVTSPSPSPLLSPPRIDDDQLHHQLPEVYVCGKVSEMPKRKRKAGKPTKSSSVNLQCLSQTIKLKQRIRVKKKGLISISVK